MPTIARTHTLVVLALLVLAVGADVACAEQRAESGADKRAQKRADKRSDKRAKKRANRRNSAARGPCTRVASPNGSDHGPGTERRPFRTVQRLVGSLRPGMTGCLRRGTYREDVKVSRGGRRGKRVVLRSYPRERARIVGRFWVARGADHVTVSGLHLDGRSDSTLPSPTINADNVTFRRNDVTNGHTGICFIVGSPRFGSADNTVISGNRIHDCGRLPRTNHDHGIYVEDATRTKILGNWIHDNADRGIQLYPNSVGAVIRGNVIYGNATGIIFSGAGEYATSDTLVEGNVISDSVDRYNVESFWEDDRVGTNNIVRRNCLGPAARGAESGGIRLPPEGFELEANLMMSPPYRDAAARDFRLPEKHPCGRLLEAPQAVPGAR